MESIIVRLLEATAWRMERPAPYSAFHLVLLWAGIPLAFFAAKAAGKSFRSRPAACVRLLFFCGLLLAVIELYKQLFLYWIVNDGCYDWWYFPFQLCSVPMYLCLLLPLASQRLRPVFCTFIQDFGLLGGVMARLPLAALAGVLMVTAWRMNDWEGIRYLLSHRFKSGISQFFITMIATVAADLTVAILVGIVYSALLYIVKASHINVSFSDIDASRLPGAPCGEMPRAGVAYVTGSLFFGAVDEFSRLMAEMPDYREVIFSLRGMPSLDVSGAQALLELCTHLKEQGRGVAFCGVAPEVRLYFDRAGITALVGEDAFFWSADQAIFALLEKESAAV